MSRTNINIRTDSELKEKAQSVLADLGLDMSTAINIFLNQIVYKQAIPFEISKQTEKPERKRHAKKSLEERFENYDGDYQPIEYDWGKPVGREYW